MAYWLIALPLVALALAGVAVYFRPKLRPKRPACLHLYGDAPSIRGLLCGKWGGHYVVLVPKALIAKDQSESLSGYVEVPKERVMFVQILDRADE